MRDTIHDRDMRCFAVGLNRAGLLRVLAGVERILAFAALGRNYLLSRLALPAVVWFFHNVKH